MRSSHHTTAAGGRPFALGLGPRVGAWVGNEAAERKRREVLRRVRPFVEFQPKRAPDIGAVIDIRIHYKSPRPLATAAWKEWHT